MTQTFEKSPLSRYGDVSDSVICHIEVRRQDFPVGRQAKSPVPGQMPLRIGWTSVRARANLFDRSSGCRLFGGQRTGGGYATIHA